MPDTIYPHTKDVLKHGMWVQKRNKQGVVICLDIVCTDTVRIKALVNWTHKKKVLAKLKCSTVDSIYLKPIKPLI